MKLHVFLTALGMNMLHAISPASAQEACIEGMCLGEIADLTYLQSIGLVADEPDAKCKIYTHWQRKDSDTYVRAYIASIDNAPAKYLSIYKTHYLDPKEYTYGDAINLAINRFGRSYRKSDRYDQLFDRSTTKLFYSDKNFSHIVEIRTKINETGRTGVIVEYSLSHESSVANAAQTRCEASEIIKLD